LAAYIALLNFYIFRRFCSTSAAKTE